VTRLRHIPPIGKSVPGPDEAVEQAQAAVVDEAEIIPATVLD
jgi:hypothetical protein